MSESIDMLFGDLRSLLNQSERDVAWTADLTALLELAIGEDRDAFMARWHPYLVSHRLHLTEANFPPISVASIDELEWWEETLPFANFNLALGARSISSEQFEALLDPERLSHIRGLDLGKHPEAKEFLLSLARFEEPLPLETLILRDMSLEANHVTSVVQTVAFQNLQRLDLGKNSLGDDVITLLTRDTHLKHLRHLDLSRVGLTIESTRTLSRELGLLRQLESLWLDHNELEARGAHRLVHALPEDGNLRTLGLRGVGLGDMVMRLFGQAPALAQLTSLDLGFNWLSDRGIFDLFSVYSPANLRELRLSGNRLTNASGFAIAHRGDLENLRVLDLSFNNLGHTMAHELAKNTSLSTLHELILTGNELTLNSTARQRLLDSPNTHAHITW